MWLCYTKDTNLNLNTELLNHWQAKIFDSATECKSDANNVSSLMQMGIPREHRSHTRRSVVSEISARGQLNKKAKHKKCLPPRYLLPAILPQIIAQRNTWSLTARAYLSKIMISSIYTTGGKCMIIRSAVKFGNENFGSDLISMFLQFKNPTFEALYKYLGHYLRWMGQSSNIYC